MDNIALGRDGLNSNGQTPPPEFYVASDIKSKRHRRTKVDIAGIRAAIIDILSKDNPANGEAGLLRADRPGRDREGRGRVPTHGHPAAR